MGVFFLFPGWRHLQESRGGVFREHPFKSFGSDVMAMLSARSLNRKDGRKNLLKVMKSFS